MEEYHSYKIMPSQTFVTIFFQNPCSYTEHSNMEYGKKSEKKCIFLTYPRYMICIS